MWKKGAGIQRAVRDVADRIERGVWQKKRVNLSNHIVLKIMGFKAEQLIDLETEICTNFFQS